MKTIILLVLISVFLTGAGTALADAWREGCANTGDGLCDAIGDCPGTCIYYDISGWRECMYNLMSCTNENCVYAFADYLGIPIPSPCLPEKSCSSDGIFLLSSPEYKCKVGLPFPVGGGGFRCEYKNSEDCSAKTYTECLGDGLTIRTCKGKCDSGSLSCVKDTNNCTDYNCGSEKSCSSAPGYECQAYHKVCSAGSCVWPAPSQYVADDTCNNSCRAKSGCSSSVTGLYFMYSCSGGVCGADSWCSSLRCPGAGCYVNNDCTCPADGCGQGSEVPDYVYLNFNESGTCKANCTCDYSGCLSSSDDCRDCSCSCGGYNIEESPKTLRVPEL